VDKRVKYIEPLSCPYKMEVFIFIMYNPYPTLKSCLNLRDKRATSVCSYTDIQKKVLQERTKTKTIIIIIIIIIRKIKDTQ